MAHVSRSDHDGPGRPIGVFAHALDQRPGDLAPPELLLNGRAGTVDRLQSTCPDGNTCIAGTCTPSVVPVQMLPDYKPQSVFGVLTEAKSGTCFDTVACMAGGMVVDPHKADCTIAKPTGVDGLNVALRVAADGICDDTGTTCFVPIDGNK